MFEPSKRLFLGNLPEDVTKKDVADFIRRRTRANPMHMEIGKTKKGDGCFAHCTVEGLKTVIEALNDMPLKNNRVVAAAAKPHYVAALQQARKERERREREVEDAKVKAQAEIDEKLQQLRESGEKQILPPPKPFYQRRQQYSKIASEIAAKCRAAFGAAHPELGYRRQAGGKAARPSAGAAEGGEPTAKKPRQEKEKKTVTVVKPPTPPPEPSKEEKKLNALQARLLALKAKAKK